MPNKEKNESEKKRHPFRQARPPTGELIDWNRVDELIEAGCTKAEIMPFFPVSESCFTESFHVKHGENFSVYAFKIKSRGDAHIKEAKFRKAIGRTKKGDTQLLMYLGRTRLGEVEASTANCSQEVIDAYKAATGAIADQIGTRIVLSPEILFPKKPEESTDPDNAPEEQT